MIDLGVPTAMGPDICNQNKSRILFLPSPTTRNSEFSTASVWVPALQMSQRELRIS